MNSEIFGLNQNTEDNTSEVILSFKPEGDYLKFKNELKGLCFVLCSLHSIGKCTGAVETEIKDPTLVDLQFLATVEATDEEISCPMIFEKNISSLSMCNIPPLPPEEFC